MAKAYWVATYRAINDPDKMAAYAALSGPAIVAAGFKSIICARPDGEDNGQPCFSDVADEARRNGLEPVHSPVSGDATRSGYPSVRNVA